MDYAGDDTEAVNSAEGSDIPEPSFAPQEMVGETLDHSEIDALADAFNMVDMSAIEQEGNLNELLKDGDNAASQIFLPSTKRQRIVPVWTLKRCCKMHQHRMRGKTGTALR